MPSLADRLRSMTPSVTPAPVKLTLADKIRAVGTGAEKIAWSSRHPVSDSPDLQRILALPTRVLEQPPGGHFSSYRREQCADPECAFYNGLRPLQAAALYDIKKTGGALAIMAVGTGKTLVSLLAGTVLGAKRTVLLVPSQVREQLLVRDIPHLAQHWQIPNLADGKNFFTDTQGILYVFSYSGLSSVRQADFLDRVKPDLVVADECHSVKATSAARTRRFRRYFKANPDTKLLALSGTITSKSIKEYWHLAALSLGQGSPLPRSYNTVEEWAAALDSGDAPADPGALERLCESGEDVRSGFRRRLISTSGVIANHEEQLGTSLYLHKREVAVPESIASALQTMRETWCTPGGEEISDAIVFWAHARELAAGMYLRWIWPRGEPLEVRREWLDARRDWNVEIRTMLKCVAKPGLDSPLLLYRAASRGQWASQTWARWHEVRKTAKPETEAVWLSTYLCDDAAAWGQEHKGIIFYEHDAVGRMVAERGGFPFYGGGAQASKDILAEKGNRTIVASIRAHGEGKNLQCFSKQLYVSVPSSAKTFEQAIGRCHRFGQSADEVNVWMYLHTPEMFNALNSARKAASYIEETTGAPQKILLGTHTY